jgi:hypothetical protein
MRKCFAIVLLLAILMTAIGCDNAQYSSATSPTRALSLDDQAFIYAAIIRQLATVDDSFGGNLKPSRLFIIRETDDKAGNPTGPGTFSSPIIQSTQDKITDLIKDLASIIWIDKFENAEFEAVNQNLPSNKSVKNGGAIITMGNARLQTDGSAQACGSIYVGSLAAAGTTYVLEKKNGVWTITGTTGAHWIS